MKKEWTTLFTIKIFTERSVVFFMISKLINPLSICYLKFNDQYNYQEEQSSVCKLQIQIFKWKKKMLCMFICFFTENIRLISKIELFTAKRK